MKMKFSKHTAQRTGVLLLVSLSCALIVRFGRADEPVIRIGDWPVAPTSVEPELMAIMPPIPKPPPMAPLTDAGNKSPVQGQIVYAPEIIVPEKAAVQRYFAFHGVGVTGTVGKVETSDVHYKVRPFDQIYDPQYSPDGNYLLFKVGDPTTSWASYALCLWDLKQQKVARLSVYLSWRWVSWSPDSNYLAFVLGGDREGYVDRDIDRLKLYIYSLHTRKIHLVVMNPAVTSFAWTHQGTLLFTIQPGMNPNNELANGAMGLVPENETAKDSSKRFDIYEVDAEQGPLKKLISQGYKPTPSLDGKWIAYIGWLDTPLEKGDAQSGIEKKLTTASTGARALFLYNRIDNKRILLRKTGVGSLLWTPDSQHLIDVQELYSKAKKAGQGTCRIEQLDIKNLILPQWKLIANIQAIDFAPIPRGDAFPQFEPQMSRNGRYLFVKVSEFFELDGNYMNENKTLKAVNLHDGTVRDIARLKNIHTRVTGYAWREIEQPIGPSGSVTK